MGRNHAHIHPEFSDKCRRDDELTQKIRKTISQGIQ